MKIIYNEDAKLVEIIKKHVINNNGYCPCSTEKIPDTKCMCKAFREQKNEGFCHCQLYRKIKE